MKLTQDWQNLATLSLITVAIWAGIELYNSFITPATPVIYQELIKPLDPALDLNLLESLKYKKDYSELVDNIEGKNVTTEASSRLPPIDDTINTSP